MKRSIFIATILLALWSQLIAADFKVLVWPQNEEISSYVTTLFPYRQYSQSTAASIEERQLRYSQKQLGEALHKAYAGESEKSIGTALDAYVKLEAGGSSEEPFNVVLSEAGSTFDLEAVLSADRNYLDYICTVSDSDLLVVPVKSVLGSFIHLSLYFYEYETGTFSLGYESLSVDSDRFSTRSALQLGRMILGSETAMLRLENLVPATEITVDGRVSGCSDGCLVLTEGQHVIELACLGYSSKALEVDLAAGSILTVDAGLEKKHHGQMTITSFPSGASVYLDGTVAGTTPYTLTDYAIPMSLRLSADGYDDRVVAIVSERALLDVPMKPLWLTDDKVFVSAKEEFYSDFARSLIIFGVKLLAGAMDDGTSNLPACIMAAADGALVLSLGDLAGSLFNYYRQAEYTSR